MIIGGSGLERKLFILVGKLEASCEGKKSSVQVKGGTSQLGPGVPWQG